LDVNRRSLGELLVSLEACFAREPERSSAAPVQGEDFRRALSPVAQRLVQVLWVMPARPRRLVHSARRQ
jgi:hypothetical protein